MKEFIKNEFKGWNKFEVMWLIIATLVITGLSIYWGDSLMGIISASTGVICVILTGKGKLSAYLFGLVNCVLYAIISYKATYYGETMLNALYYVPMQFVGFYVWFKNMNSETNEVNKRHMSFKLLIITALSIIVLTAVYALLLKHLGDAMPFVDSFTTVSSVVAMIVSVGMYSEQWHIWVLVDIFSTYMWFMDFLKGNDNIATLLMWIIYLGNAIIMLVKWEKEAIKNDKKKKELIKE